MGSETRITMDYLPTAEAVLQRTCNIHPGREDKFPHYVKVGGIWHTEILVRMREFINDSGGQFAVNYDTKMSEFIFAEESLCTLFMVRFRGVLVDDIYKR